MQKIINWLRAVLSEANGVPSSIRVCLFLAVAAVVGCVVYIIVQHAIHHTINNMIDVPKNLSDLLAFTIGALAAAKTGSKFGESSTPENMSGTIGKLGVAAAEAVQTKLSAKANDTSV
jgi:hypothetical protein